MPESLQKRRRLTRNQREAVAAWLFILPDVVGLTLFVALPMLFSLSLGFFSVNGFGATNSLGSPTTPGCSRIHCSSRALA